MLHTVSTMSYNTLFAICSSIAGQDTNDQWSSLLLISSAGITEESPVHRILPRSQLVIKHQCIFFLAENVSTHEERFALYKN